MSFLPIFSFVAFSSSMVFAAELDAKWFVVPKKNLVSDVSEIIIVNSRGVRISAENLTPNSESVRYPVGDDTCFLVEIDSREEESYKTSILRSWELTPLLRVTAPQVNLARSFKYGITLKNVPKEWDFVVFFKIEGDKLGDWVEIYQAVVDGKVSDRIFSSGFWAVGPVGNDQTSGREDLTSEFRVFHVVEDEVSLDFSRLPRVPRIGPRELRWPRKERVKLDEVWESYDVDVDGREKDEE